MSEQRRKKNVALYAGYYQAQFYSFYILNLLAPILKNIQRISIKHIATRKCVSAILSIEKNFVIYRRYFDSPNCGSCMYKASSYCWVNAP